MDLSLFKINLIVILSKILKTINKKNQMGLPAGPFRQYFS
jgi:hypothetical protein